MNKSQINFYRAFYGSNFYRNFRRPTELSNHKKIRTQLIVQNPMAITFHVERSNGKYPSYVHVYDQKNRSRFIDRAFFDFDISHPDVKQLISELQELRRSCIEEGETIAELKIRLNELIIKDEIAKPAIQESIEFAKIFKKSFGKLPFLLFSGCKGAHIYAFFEPTEFTSFNKTITWFAERVKETYDLHTLDLAVNRDALSRVSRVPYSKHQYTDLSVVPFRIEDSYDCIMHKTVLPEFEQFYKENYITKFNLFLRNREEELYKLNTSFKSAKRINTKSNGENKFYHQIKVRKSIKALLGEPVKAFDRYDLYHCPFHDPDNNPSFAVYEKNYHCFGCGKHGNFWQFYKDYYGWDDDQVRYYLKQKKERI